MAFSRTEIPDAVSAGSELTRAMVGIGMAFDAPPAVEPNIEDTLLAASLEGMIKGDLRVLSVLTNWLGVHHAWVNADRLIRAVNHLTNERVRAYWAAVGAWLRTDRRFSRLGRLYEGPRVKLLPVGSEFQVKRRGEDPRFVNTPILIAAGLLRDRPSDVLSPRDLARQHRTYRERIRIGPTYRADMWAVLRGDPDISASDLAHKTYGSYGTAWKVKNDFDLLHGIGTPGSKDPSSGD